MNSEREMIKGGGEWIQNSSLLNQTSMVFSTFQDTLVISSFYESNNGINLKPTIMVGT